MVELTVNGKEIELALKGDEIKYTMQIADVFDIATVYASRTNAFSIPKTPYNTQVFNQLGIAGDGSRIPYEKVPVTLKSDGFSIIQAGWLTVKETTDEYKVTIMDGMIDFAKAIENKTMGGDLDLSIFAHEKNLEAVIASFTNPNYKYLVADYGGATTFKLPEVEIYLINIDYLVPSFSVKKLLDIVFETFGFTYNPADIPLIDGLYITYPIPPLQGSDQLLYAVMEKEGWVSSNFANWNGRKYVPSREYWDESDITEGELVNNWRYKVPEDGTYIVEAIVEAYARYSPLGLEMNIGARLHLMVNGQSVGSILTDPMAAVTFNEEYAFSQGDIIQIRISTQLDYSESVDTIRHNSTLFKVYKKSIGDINLTDPFKDFQVKDFFKEILWRSGLTPVIDVITRHISFIPLSDRLDISNAIDWTDKYIQRKKETYIQGSYAQKNTFKLKHNNDADTFGDGHLLVDNANLNDEKTIAASKLYAPEPNIGGAFTDRDGNNEFGTHLYRIWEGEPKEDEEGNIVMEYRGLSGRFYFQRIAQSAVSTYILYSPTLDEADGVSQVPYAVNNGTLFQELIYNNYAPFVGLLNNFRAHDIELALSLNDVLSLSFINPYYFGQEGHYYLLNKLSWQNGKTCTGEFIRYSPLLGAFAVKIVKIVISGNTASIYYLLNITVPTVVLQVYGYSGPVWTDYTTGSFNPMPFNSSPTGNMKVRIFAAGQYSNEVNITIPSNTTIIIP